VPYRIGIENVKFHLLIAFFLILQVLVLHFLFLVVHPYKTRLFFLLTLTQ